MDRSLGRPLPYQQANPTQAPPKAPGPKVPSFTPKGICGISPSFPGLSPTLGQIPTRYSPVRHSSAPSKLGLLPFDLHVLGMPPAFNLSQDQTLHLSFVAAGQALRCFELRVAWRPVHRTGRSFASVHTFAFRRAGMAIPAILDIHSPHPSRGSVMAVELTVHFVWLHEGCPARWL